MKKLILFFIILGIFIKVDAKTYYGDYSECRLSLNKEASTDTVNVTKKDGYLLYKETKKAIFYPSYEKPKNLEKTSETKKVSSDWLEKKPEELEGRVIEEKKFYKYRDPKKVRYLKVYNLTNDTSNFEISEIRIYKGAKRIDYDILSDIPNIDRIKDDNLKNTVVIEPHKEIIIDLKENIAIADFRMMYYFHTESDANIGVFTSLFGEENKNIYFTNIITSYIEKKDNEYFSFLLDIDCFNSVNPLYEDEVLSEKVAYPNKFRDVKEITMYKYEDTYIKYYEVSKEYLDGYYLEGKPGYLIDQNSKRSVYCIQTRDKLELIEPLLISSYDTKLENLIVSTTNNNIKITSNINYYKNGLYDVNFIMNGKIIKTKVTVDIKANYLEALKNQNKYLKELEKDNEELFKNDNQLNAALKESLEEKDKLNDKLLKYQSELESVKKSKQELNTVESKSKNPFLPLFIGLILWLLILGFILLYKRKDKENKETENI